MEPNVIAILGAGAWGTALGYCFASAGYKVRLWCYESEVATQITQYKTNTYYLPGITLPETLNATFNMSEVLNDVSYVVEAIPVPYMRSALTKALPYVSEKQTWIVTSKGIEANTLLFPCDIVRSVLGYTISVGCVSGPSLASELVLRVPTALAIAHDNSDIRNKIHDLMSISWTRIIPSADLVGVQVCGALKNVYTIILGLLQGGNYGFNAQAYLFIKICKELESICAAVGGLESTVYSVAGIGDIFVSSYGPSSKNKALGYALATGQSLDDFYRLGSVYPEGVNTARIIGALALKYGAHWPIATRLVYVLDKKLTIADYVRELLT